MMEQNFRILWAFILFGLTTGHLYSQNPELNLYLEMNPRVTQSEIVDLSKIASGERVQGRRILVINLRNNGNQRAENLFLDLRFSTNEGVLWEVYQENNTSIDLREGQSIFATNNNFVTGRITGVPGNVNLNFKGRITDEGRSFMRRLQNHGELESIEFTLEAGVYQGNNRQNGGIQVAGKSVVVGIQPSEYDAIDNFIVLIAPGKHMEARPPENITHSYPEFRWQGSRNRSYRVVVVEDQPGQNPENLIQRAIGTPAANHGKSAELLNFENVDLIVETHGFQYPSFGVAPLQTGKRYFWQVFTEDGMELASEIWSFRLTGGGSGRRSINEAGGQGMKMEDEELRSLLTVYLGMNVVRELERENFELLDIELKGVRYSGERAIQELSKLLEEVRSGKVDINKIRQP